MTNTNKDKQVNEGDLQEKFYVTVRGDLLSLLQFSAVALSDIAKVDLYKHIEGDSLHWRKDFAGDKIVYETYGSVPEYVYTAIASYMPERSVRIVTTSDYDASGVEMIISDEEAIYHCEWDSFSGVVPIADTEGDARESDSDVLAFVCVDPSECPYYTVGKVYEPHHLMFVDGVDEGDHILSIADKFEKEYKGFDREQFIANYNKAIKGELDYE